MLITAAILIILTAAVHSYLGERYILMRLFRREQPKLFGDDSFTKGTLRFCWHLLSIVWLALAAILLTINGANDLGESRETLLWIISISLFASAPFPFLMTRGRHLSWVILLIIGILCLPPLNS